MITFMLLSSLRLEPTVDRFNYPLEHPMVPSLFRLGLTNLNWGSVLVLRLRSLWIVVVRLLFRSLRLVSTLLVIRALIILTTTWQLHHEHIIHFYVLMGKLIFFPFLALLFRGHSFVSHSHHYSDHM